MLGLINKAHQMGATALKFLTIGELKPIVRDRTTSSWPVFSVDFEVRGSRVLQKVNVRAKNKARAYKMVKQHWPAAYIHNVARVIK